MEGKGNISDYRSKLEKTLASPDLTNDEKLQTLVRNQILQSSHLQFEGCIENVVERRSKEVSNFLSMLRSVSVNNVERSKSGKDSHGDWKVKQDTEEFQVMYREGPEGTPFHTLLVEGYVDGPLDVCLCVSWESGLYKKWWPQTAIPTFKIISSQCLQRVRTGEQISLVRMKVSWPLSSREAVVHYFAFEYFQDDLMVVLLNSISDSETVDRCTHGFTRDGIPDPGEVVRIDVVGGLAFQKVTADRSYFRAIANMDIKLDFVPPSFINFISRQLLGSGFKLYQKEVACVSNGDQKFTEALNDPLYTRIREGLYSGSHTRSKDLENPKRGTSVTLEGQSGGACEDENAKENNRCDYSIVDSAGKDVMLTSRGTNELNEEETFVDNCNMKSSNCSTGQITDKFGANKEVYVSNTEGAEALRKNKIRESYRVEIGKKVPISPEVEGALGTLEKAISVFQERRNNCQSGITNSSDLINLEKEAVEESTTLEADESSRNCVESSTIVLSSFEPQISLDNHASRQKGSSSYTKETNQSKIVPDQEPSSTPLTNSNHIAHNSCMNQKSGSTADAESTNRNNTKSRFRFCCLHFNFK